MKSTFRIFTLILLIPSVNSGNKENTSGYADVQLQKIQMAMFILL